MILVILPVKNEQNTVEETARKLYDFFNTNFQDFQILFIDDESNDMTFNTVNRLHTELNKKVSVIKNRFDRGKGSSLKAAFVLSDLIYKMSPQDLIVFLDGDGQIEADEVSRLLNQMEIYKADVVIGNKRHTYSVTSYSLTRRIVSSVYNLMIRFLFDIGYMDTQCGVKIFKKHALDKVIHKVNVKKYAFDLELLVALRGTKMFIVDCPVKIQSQMNKGSVSLENIYKTFIDTLEIWNKQRKGFYA